MRPGDFGRLDILVSNAGWVARTPLEEMTPELLARILDIHVAAPLWLAQAALPIMKRQQYGRVVLTSSGIGLWTEGDRPELLGLCDRQVGPAWIDKRTDR